MRNKPMDTPRLDSKRSSASHMPGIGLRNSSAAVAAKAKKGILGIYAKILVSLTQVSACVRGLQYLSCNQRQPLLELVHVLAGHLLVGD